jgi:hypothetical protein
MLERPHVPAQTHHLPWVASFTYIDSHALVSSFFMLMTIAAVFLTHHRLNRRGVEAARAVRHKMRVAFPASELIVFLVEAASFFIAATGSGSGSHP